MEENSSDGDFFSKHFGLIHLAGLRVLKHFFFLKKPSFLSFRFISVSLHFLFHLLFILSLFFILSFFFTLLVLSLLFSRSSLLFSLAFSFIFTCLFSPLSSPRFSFIVSSSLFLSCPVLSVSLSLSVSLCLRVVLCCVLCLCCVCGVVCGAAWHAEKTSVCRFKTSPCVPAPRAHVVPVHTGTF